MSDENSGEFSGEYGRVGNGVPDHRPIRNPAGIALIVVGLLAAVVGAILWGVGAHQAASDRLSAEFGRAVGLDNGLNMPIETSAVDADNALIWWGIALVILGVLMLVARLVIAAATPRLTSVQPLRPSLSERRAERKEGD